MIQTDVGLRQTIDVIASMYLALAELHQRVAPQNFRNYLIMAEGPVEEIRRAQRDVNNYLGVADQFASQSEVDRQAG
ncbi:MAG TPA: hypothetical protein VGI40_10995 [Pirellulaceae bacterium]